MKSNHLHLLLRSFDAELDRRERSRLDALLEASPEMRSERRRLARMRSLIAEARADSFRPGFADRVLRETASAGPAETADGWIDRIAAALASRRLPAAIAAAVLVLLSVGVAYWMLPQTIAVPNGPAQTLTLSDGSTVELSGGSTLTFARFVGRSERRIELEGEAFFDVTPGERPFLVETFNASIRVVGTRFNVRAWPDDPEAGTAVALAEGRVALEPKAGADEPEVPAARNVSRSVVLAPGELASVRGDSTSAPREAALGRVLAWRSGGLDFADESLASVFRTIERRFGVRVTAAHPGLLNLTIAYLNPSPESAAAVLADICHTLDLRYRRTAGGFEVLQQDSTAL